MSAPLPVRTEEPSSSPAGAKYRWYVLGLLFVVSIVNTFDKSLVPALAEPIKAEFGLSDSQLGFLAGMIFAISYSIFGIPVGLLIDRVNRSRLLGVLLAVWSVATMISGAVSSFVALVLARMGVAAAESGGNPTSISLISDYFRPDERSTAVGIFYANNAFASFLVFSLAGYIAATHGWRTAFLLAGIPGLFLTVIVLLTLREPPRGALDSPAKREAGPRPGLREIVAVMLRNRTLLLLGAAAVLIVAGQAGISAFAVPFYIRVHGLELAEAGLTVGIVAGSATAIGSSVGGYVADRASRRLAGGGCYFVSVAALLAAVFAIAGLLATDLRVSIAFIFLYASSASSFFGATFAAIAGAAPGPMQGAVTAYVMIAMNLGGYGFGPQLSGIASDLFRAAGAAEPLRWALVAITPILMVSGLLYLLVGRRLSNAGG